jgi:hypothetical protein
VETSEEPVIAPPTGAGEQSWLPGQDEHRETAAAAGETAPASDGADTVEAGLEETVAAPAAETVSTDDAASDADASGEDAD